jgi:hypothetical protein
MDTKALKLHGMTANFPEVAAKARHTEFNPETFLVQLLKAEIAECVNFYTNVKYPSWAL